MNPKVSIIMATYNRAHFIVETLLAIQNQTFLDWECLIIDDGGTDNTKELITPILEQDSRFKYSKRTENYIKGLPGCRNYGLDLAKGDYIIFFDDDDIVHPQNLELCIDELSKKDISYCRYIRDVFFDDFDCIFDYSKMYTSFYIDSTDLEKMIKNESVYMNKTNVALQFYQGVLLAIDSLSLIITKKYVPILHSCPLVVRPSQLSSFEFNSSTKTPHRLYIFTTSPSV